MSASSHQPRPSVFSRVFSPEPRENTQPLAPTGRAGRNLPAAVSSAVVLIALLVASLLVVQGIFVAFVCCIALLGLWELGGAFARVVLGTRGRHNGAVLDGFCCRRMEIG